MSWRSKRINSATWARVRKQVFERDGYRCTSCGKAGRLECHHRVSLWKGGARYDLTNLETLCSRCHLAVTAEQNSKGSFNKKQFEILQASRRSWQAFVDARRRESASV